MAAPTGTVLAATSAATGLNMLHHMKTGDFHFTVIFNGFMLGAALIGLSFLSPALAKGFALLVLVGSVLTNGIDVFGGLAGLK